MKMPKMKEGKTVKNWKWSVTQKCNPKNQPYTNMSKI